MSTQNAKIINGKTWWQRNRIKIFGALVTGGPVAAIMTLALSFFEEVNAARAYAIELTEEEEVLLDHYVDTKFIPFFNTLMQMVDGAIISQTQRSTIIANPVITNVNTVRKQIAILKKWLAHTTQYRPKGYTGNMIMARNGFVNEQLDALEAAITEYLASRNVTALPTKQVIYIDSERETFGMEYTWSTRGITTTYAKLDEATIVEDLSSDPVEIVIPDTVIDAIETATGGTTTTNTNQQPANSQPPAKSSSNIFWKLLAVAGISFAIAKSTGKSSK